MAMMPNWFLFYLILMSLGLLANVAYAVVVRCHWWWIPYELASGAYFLGFAAGYWLPELHYALHPLLQVAVFGLLLGVESGIAITSRPEDFFRQLPVGIGPEELAWAKAFSALAMLPAYIVGTIFCAALLKG